MKNSNILLLLLLPLLVACSKDADEAVQQPALSNIPILLTAESETAVTRGLNPMSGNNIYVMGVFAGYESDDETFSSSSVANDFVNNVRYTRSFKTDPFAGDDVCYWPFSGKLSFFAYAPYVSSQNLKFASDYTSGYPRMSYTPTQDVTNQPDLCFAIPVLDQHITTSAIPLQFTHSLSQIVFSANYSGTLPNSNLYVKIDNISICNVIGTKTVTMSNGTPCFDWQGDGECTDDSRTSYSIKRGGLAEEMHINDKTLPMATDPVTDNYLNMSSANGILYLIPQSMTYGEVYLQVTYGYYETVNGSEVCRASTTTKCNLPEATWLPANSYRYKFTIDLATNSIVTPTVTVGAWNDVNNTESNPIHLE